MLKDDLKPETTQVEALQQTNSALMQEVMQLRSYLEIANGIILNIFPDGSFNSISANWLQYLGYDLTYPEQRLYLIDTVHPDDYETVINTILNVIRTGKKHFGLDYRSKDKDGTWRWFTANSAPMKDADGNINSVLAMVWDVTQEKEIELQLKNSNTKFRLLFETMREGVVIVDNDDIIQFINTRCCNIFGYKQDELIGKVGNQYLIHEDDRHEIVLKNLQRVQGLADEYELRGRKTNGDVIWLKINGAPLRDEKGKVIGSVGVMTDITESKYLKEQLLASQKMEAIGKLAGGIAHDFNNLLNIILGYSEELKDELPKDSPLLIGVSEIMKAGERASGLTRQLLTFSRMQIVRPKVLDINELLASISATLQRLIGDNIIIKTELSSVLPTIKIDPGQIELIIVNLAINAKDAMPKGGVFTIETSVVNVGKDYLLSRPDIKVGHYVQLKLSDTGCGMDNATLSRIFEPFFTTKGIGSGVGLGLSTVYGIVQQADGYIMVESEPDKGSCFTLLFPCSDEEVERTTPQGQDQHYLGKGEHILIVEDEKALLSYFAKLIKNLGYRVSSSSDSQEALEMVRKGLRPDLLITDVVMPGMNGKQLSDEVLMLVPDQKLLFMSGFTDDAIVQYDVFERGMPFIQKPFNSKEIAIQIRKVLDADKPQKLVANIFMLDDEDGIRRLFERSCKKREHNFSGAATLQEALEMLSKESYDILLVDMHLLGMDGVYALTKIREAGINTPAIIFSGAIRSDDRDALRHLGVIKTVEKSFDNTPVLVFIEDYLSGSNDSV